MILGDFNVTLDFARDTSNYLTGPHKTCRKVINQWLYNREYADVYEDLHPGRSSYMWRKSIDKLAHEGDNNFRTVSYDKQSRIDHTLLSPFLLDVVKSIEHIYYGLRPTLVKEYLDLVLIHTEIKNIKNSLGTVLD